jgi:hypothetical protein
MNTLSRAITVRFFPNQDSYNALRKQWSALINSTSKSDLSAAHHLLYLALLGKDWRKAFTPPTNQLKLDNGAFFGWMMFRALQTLHNPFVEKELLAPFDGQITLQMLQGIRSVLPLLHAYKFQPQQFSNGAFPFEAFKDETFTILKTGDKADE